MNVINLKTFQKPGVGSRDQRTSGEVKALGGEKKDLILMIEHLPRYDQEMFDFHHKIEALEEQWGREKQELAKVKLLILLEIETKAKTLEKETKVRKVVKSG